MKNIAIILIAIITIIGISTTSCKKVDDFLGPKEQDTTAQHIIDSITAVREALQLNKDFDIFNKWKLVDGYMYFDNLGTGQLTYKSHFGNDRKKSSLRFDGVMYELEQITKFGTTWEFKPPYQIPGNGQFILNGDDEQPYGLYITNNSIKIVEDPYGEEQQLSGSARPLQFSYAGQDSISVIIQEAYESINGDNYSYFTELIFEKID